MGSIAAGLDGVTASLDAAAEKLGGRPNLTAALDVSSAAVSQWWTGKRPVPPKQAVRIEQLTGVSRRNFRPKDWAEHWPELVEEA